MNPKSFRFFTFVSKCVTNVFSPNLYYYYTLSWAHIFQSHFIRMCRHRFVLQQQKILRIQHKYIIWNQPNIQ